MKLQYPEPTLAGGGLRRKTATPVGPPRSPSACGSQVSGPEFSPHLHIYSQATVKRQKKMSGPLNTCDIFSL